jgi:hypothetical protein
MQKYSAKILVGKGGGGCRAAKDTILNYFEGHDGLLMFNMSWLSACHVA